MVLYLVGEHGMKQDISFDVWINNRFENKNTAKQYLNCHRLWKREGHQLDKKGVEEYISNHNHGLSRAFVKIFLEYNEIKDIEIPNPRSRKGVKIYNFLTKKQVDYIINNLPLKESIMVRLYFETGLRLNELLNRQVHDFDLNARTVRGIGKGNKPFEEKYSNRTRDILISFLGKLDRIDYPFKYDVGHSDKKFGYLLKKKCVEMGIPQVTPHKFRHALGHHLRADKGLDLEQIRVKLRHEKLSTVQIYATATKEEVDDKIDREVFDNV